MKIIDIAPHGKKVGKVLIGDGILQKLGEIVFQNGIKGKICIVSDNAIAPLYLRDAISSLRTAGYKVCSLSFVSGEENKTVDTYTRIISSLSKCGLTRSDTVIALGGGVTGDIVGFAASTYLRGINFIQVPTTLIAQTDSAIGGKNGVNLPSGKNLLGTFYHPSLTVCDPLLLKSLPRSEFCGGVAEIIKYGVACDKELFTQIENGDLEKNPESIIYKCINIKKNYVEEDEFDNGSRQILNFGHTIGQALEKLSGYTLSHGICVGTGMALITKCAVCAGKTDISVYTRIVNLLTKYGIPTDTPYTPEQIVSSVSFDKKRSGDEMTLIIPKSIGCAVTLRTDYESACEFISDGLNTLWT